MASQEPHIGKETSPRLWAIGYRLSWILVCILVAGSFIGFPEDQVVTVLESSALSKADLIESGMEINAELAKDRPRTAPAPDIVKTEGWRSLERKVEDHREHFQAIEDERRWWKRLFNWGMVVAFLGVSVFGYPRKHDERALNQDLPKGRKHLGGKVPR